MSLLWKPCARYFSTMRLLVWDQKRTWEGCGIGRLPDGPSSISMGPNRRRDNALCLRDLTCLRRNDVCQRYVRQATWDASVERWFAPAPYSGPRSYPSVALYPRSSRQWRLPRRVVTGTSRDCVLSSHIGPAARSGSRSTRWLVWQWNHRRGSHRRRSRLRDAWQRLCEARI